MIRWTTAGASHWHRCGRVVGASAPALVRAHGEAGCPRRLVPLTVGEVIPPGSRRRTLAGRQREVDRPGAQRGAHGDHDQYRRAFDTRAHPRAAA